jgi:ParB family chromosome partitioning protein
MLAPNRGCVYVRWIETSETAARFFVTPTVVKQRLRLAALSHKLPDIYAENGKTLKQLMAIDARDDRDASLDQSMRQAAGTTEEVDECHVTHFVPPRGTPLRSSQFAHGKFTACIRRLSGSHP